MTTLKWADRKQGRAWAVQFAKALKRPSIILLSGDLGAGKTQVVKWVLEQLGVADASSPTFAIHQQFTTPAGVIDHVDLYRLKSDADLESSGFWDLLKPLDGLVFVEWADRLPADVWPTSWTQIAIHLKKIGDGEEREITLATKPPR
jgi:tRNA threonylcarbamoyladenosine biosynthesis protein TsaE